MTRGLRIGLIGIGRIGAFHAATLAEMDGVDLVIAEARTTPRLEHRPVRMSETRA